MWLYRETSTVVAIRKNVLRRYCKACDMRNLNPFTATAWRISGAERCMDEPAHGIVSGPIPAILNAMRFNGDPFTCHCDEEDKKTYGFQISHFYCSFSTDVMAVKVLMKVLLVNLAASWNVDCGCNFKTRVWILAVFLSSSNSLQPSRTSVWRIPRGSYNCRPINSSISELYFFASLPFCVFLA